MAHHYNIRTARIAVLGSQGCGKTTFINKMCYNAMPKHCGPTPLGTAGLHTLRIYKSSYIAEYIFMDYSGFEFEDNNYALNDADCYILLCDNTYASRMWRNAYLEFIRARYFYNNKPILLIQTKIDISPLLIGGDVRVDGYSGIHSLQNNLLPYMNFFTGKV